MIADLGTRKGAKIEDIGESSDWINGMSWMNGEEYDFPVKTVEEIKLSGSENKEVGEECNKPEVTHNLQDMGSDSTKQCFSVKVPGEVQERYKFSQYLIDPNRF